VQRLIHWFVHNAVAANLLMMILVVGGLLALPNTHQEEFPTLEVDAVRVNVPYLGAAPTEVESAVCVRVEEAVEGTEGIDKISSSASEGYCSVTIELVSGVDKTKVANDIKSKVDAIDAFPAERLRAPIPNRPEFHYRQSGCAPQTDPLKGQIHGQSLDRTERRVFPEQRQALRVGGGADRLKRSPPPANSRSFQRVHR